MGKKEGGILFKCTFFLLALLTIPSAYSLSPQITIGYPSNGTIIKFNHATLGATITDAEASPSTVKIFDRNNHLLYKKNSVASGTAVNYVWRAPVANLSKIAGFEERLIMHFDKESGESDSHVEDFSLRNNDADCAGAECPLFTTDKVMLGGAFIYSIDDKFSVPDLTNSLDLSTFVIMAWLKNMPASAPTITTLWTDITDPSTTFPDDGDEGRGIATDGTNVYVTGGCTDCGAGVYGAIYTMKFDSNSNKLWARAYDASGDDDDGADIAVDSNGNVYVSGRCINEEGMCQDELDDGEGGTITIEGEWFLLKYDSDGNLDATWPNIHVTPRLGGDGGEGVAIDSYNNVITTGATGCGSATAFRTIKYDSSGNQLWDKIYPCSGPANTYYHSNAIAVDNQDNIYTTGWCIDCGSNGGYAIYTVKLDSNGNEIWIDITDPTSGNDRGEGMAVDSNDNVYVTGTCTGCGSNGGPAIYTMKFDSNGNKIWIDITDPTSYSGLIWEQGNAIAVDNQDNIYVTGACDGCGAIGSNAFYTMELDSNGNHLWTDITDLGYGRDWGDGIVIDNNDDPYVTGYCSEGCATAGTAVYTMKFGATPGTPGNTVPNGTVVSKGGNYEFGIKSDRIYFNVTTNADEFELLGYTNLTPDYENEWVHIAATYTDSNKIMKIFLNGVEDSSKTVSGTIVTNNDALSIGSAAGGIDFFNGMIDELVIGSGTPGTAYIKDHYKLREGNYTWTVKADDGTGIGTTAGSFQINHTPGMEFAYPPNGMAFNTNDVSVQARVYDLNLDEVAMYWQWPDMSWEKNLFYGPYRINDSYVAYWSFENYDSTYVYDDSGNNHNGQFFGGLGAANITTGKFGKAISFGGDGDRISVSDSPELDLNRKNKTFSLWFYPRESGTGTLICKGSNTGGTNWEYVLTQEGTKVKWYVDNGASVSRASTLNINLNKWNFVAITKSRDNYTMYINGRRSDSWILPYDTLIENNYPFHMGTCGSDAYWYYDGMMDEARIWNRALTQGEIEVYYQTNNHKRFTFCHFDRNAICDSIKRDFEFVEPIDYSSLTYDSGQNMQYHQAVSVDGYLQYNANDLFYSGGRIAPASIEFWLKPEWNGNDGLTHNLLTAGKPGQNGVLVKKTPSNFLDVEFYDNLGQTKKLSYDASGWVAGTWKHVLITFTETEQKLYINGGLRDEEVYSNLVFDLTRNVVDVGGRRDAPIHYTDKADGLIDELKIYNHILAPEDINISYESGRDGFNLLDLRKTLPEGYYEYYGTTTNLYGGFVIEPLGH